MGLRWGIIGPGNIAHKFASDMRLVDNGTITAVASRSLERAKTFAAEYDIPHGYDSVEAMLEAKVCDVVYISTPHTSHQRDTLFCLKHDTHVLCEKPVTVHAEQLGEIIALHREKNLFCMEAYWTIFLPAVKKALSWISEGRIGKLQLIQANFGFKAPFNPKGRLFNLQLAGGALLDIGIYPCMFGNIFFNEKPSKVMASGVVGKTGVDELNAFQLEYSGGRILQAASSICHDLVNKAVLYGDKGRIELDDFWMSKRAVLVSDTVTDTFEDERKTNGYNFEAEAVGSMIEEGKREHDILTLARSLENMETMDEIRHQIGLSYSSDEKI